MIPSVTILTCKRFPSRCGRQPLSRCSLFCILAAMQNSMPFAASASSNVEHQEDEEQVRAEEERVRLLIEEAYNKQEAEEKAEKNSEVMAEAVDGCGTEGS